MRACIARYSRIERVDEGGFGAVMRSMSQRCPFRLGFLVLRRHLCVFVFQESDRGTHV